MRKIVTYLGREKVLREELGKYDIDVESVVCRNTKESLSIGTDLVYLYADRSVMYDFNPDLSGGTKCNYWCCMAFFGCNTAINSCIAVLQRIYAENRHFCFMKH